MRQVQSMLHMTKLSLAKISFLNYGTITIYVDWACTPRLERTVLPFLVAPYDALYHITTIHVKNIPFSREYNYINRNQFKKAIGEVAFAEFIFQSPLWHCYTTYVTKASNHLTFLNTDKHFERFRFRLFHVLSCFGCIGLDEFKTAFMGNSSLVHIMTRSL